jgi:hypothetical protein
MTWFGGVVVLLLSYQVEWYRYLWARSEDAEQEEWVRPGGRWIADRIPAIGRWQYAMLHRGMESADPVIEAPRRGARALMAVVVAWALVGWLVGPQIDAIASQASKTSPIFLVLGIGGTWLALAAVGRLLVAIRDPDRTRSLNAPLLVIAIGLAGLAITCVAAALG